MVLIFHAFPTFTNGGFIGVDIFFVISGYLIYSIIVRDLQNNNFSFFDFYFRRIRRIFPTLLIVLFFCLIFGLFLLYPQEYKELALQVIAGAGFVINFKLLSESGYFDETSENKPLLHLWSLSIEEQFYILSPLLLWICYKKKYNLFTALIAITALSFLGNILTIYKNQAAAFYVSLCRFWEIGFGAILAQLELSKKLPIASKKIGNFCASFAVILIAFCFAFLSKNSFFPGYLAIFPCLAAALFIYAGNSSWINRQILSNKFMVYIGLISYPLYLWHWPIISFLNIYKGRALRLEASIAAIAASFICAFLTYKFIEKPVRVKFTRKSHLVILVSLLLAQATFSYFIYLNNGFESQVKSNKNLLARTSNRADISDQTCLKKYQNIKNNYCRILGNGDKKIFIIGDSHSQTLFSGYSENLVKLGYQVIHLGNSACPFFVSEENIKNYNQADQQDIKACNQILQKITEEIIAQKPQAILFENGGWNYRNKDFVFGMEKTISAIPSSIKIFYFSAAPKMPFRAIKCIRDQKLSDNHCLFRRDLNAENIKLKNQELQELVKNHPNLKIMNSDAAFCDQEVCFAMDDDGLFYYRDGVHLSEYGSKYLAKKLPLKDL